MSLAALTVLNAGPVGQVRAAAAAGFGHVGLRLMPLLASDPAVVGMHDREAELISALQETGLQLLEIGVFPIKQNMDWAYITAVAAFAADRGARFLVCPVEDADETRRTCTLVRMADVAATAGLVACIEFNPYSACPTLQSAIDMLRDAQHAGARSHSLGLCLDVLHLSRSGGKPSDLTSQVRPLIRLVHLCDAVPPTAGSRSIEELRAESRTARLLPGQGALWLRELLDTLPADIPLSIEAPTIADAALPPAERAKRAYDATIELLNSKNSNR